MQALRQTTSGLLLATALVVPLSVATADRGFIAPANDPLVAKECGACHMAYAAKYLPARSWLAIVTGLANHFGENASLEPDVAGAVAAYLTLNAEGGSRSGGSETASPTVLLRITDTEWFRRRHERRGRIAPAALQRAGAKVAGDCQACHNR